MLYQYGKKKKANLSPSVEPLRIFLSEGLWAKQKPKSQSSEVGFGRGRAKGLVRSEFKEEIMRSEAVVRLSIRLAQAHEEGG